ncbi:MAG: glycosyltransferase [Pseudomonadota bacterium]
MAAETLKERVSEPLPEGRPDPLASRDPSPEVQGEEPPSPSADLALIRSVVSAFPFAHYAQIAAIMATKPLSGDVDADPAPQGDERLGPRARQAVMPLEERAVWDGGEAHATPVTRYLDYAAALGHGPGRRPGDTEDPFADPWSASCFATWYAAEGAAALGGTAPIGPALATSLNADATDPWAGLPRMSRMMAAEARRPEASGALQHPAAVANWWLHGAPSRRLAGVLTPPWLAERIGHVSSAGDGRPFPLGTGLLAIHEGSATYRASYRLDRPAHRVAFLFDLLLHLFHGSAQRHLFNPEVIDWMRAPLGDVPGMPGRFETLLALQCGRFAPAEAHEITAQAEWFRAEACSAFPAFGLFATIPEAAWIARDTTLELVGLTASATGLGQNLRMSSEALARAGVKHRLRDVEAGFAEAPARFAGIGAPVDLSETALTPQRPQDALPGELATSATEALPTLQFAMNAALGPAQEAAITPPRPRRKAMLLHVNADRAPQVLCHPLFDRHDDLYAIGYLLWELEALPRAHRLALDLLDEIWCPTRFLAEVFEAEAAVPVVLMPKGIALPPLPQLSPTKTNPLDTTTLHADGFTALVCFDFHSSVERKNPLAAVRGFQRAFPPRGGTPARLIIKTTPPSPGHWGDPNGMWPEIQRLAAADPRIVILAEHLPFERLLRLIASADCLISAHRAEGFGYLPAYALVLGCPVIATDYSGTRDFVTPETGWPVAWRPRPVAPSESILPVPGAFWADIEVDALADALRMVADKPAEAARRADAGKTLMRERYTMAACAARYRARLEAVGVL